jgi:fluoride exporter
VSLLGTIAAGGAIGAAARYGAGQAWPVAGGAFPVTTMAVNVLGCGLIGVLMVLVGELWTGRRLLRPFLGTGVLGGFTTFSTYAVDLQRLFATSHAGTAVAYLVATPVAALLAVWATSLATHRLLTWRRP